MSISGFSRSTPTATSKSWCGEVVAGWSRVGQFVQSPTRRTVVKEQEAPEAIDKAMTALIRLAYHQEDIARKVPVSSWLGDNVVELRRFRSRGLTAQETLESLLGEPRPMSAILGVHPDHPASEHPTHAFILETLIKRTTTGVARQSGLLEVPELRTSAVVIGGPLASSHAGALFGTRDGPPVFGKRLPVGFDLSQTRQRERRPEQRAAFLIDGRRVNEEHFLLTSLPMLGHRLINISALTTAGGDAADLVLGDPNLMHDLYVRTRPFRTGGWQALFRVRTAKGRPIAIDHDFQVFEVKGLDFDSASYALNDPGFLLRYGDPRNSRKLDAPTDILHNRRVHQSDELEEISRKLADYLERNPQNAERARTRITSLLASFASAATQTDPSSVRLKWSDKESRKGRNPAQFIREEYGKELGAGDLTMPWLRRTDPALYEAYLGWIRPSRHPEDDLHLPKLSDRNSDELQCVNADDLKRFRRLLSAVQRRR